MTQLQVKVLMHDLSVYEKVKVTNDRCSDCSDFSHAATEKLVLEPHEF